MINKVTSGKRDSIFFIAESEVKKATIDAVVVVVDAKADAKAVFVPTP